MISESRSSHLSHLIYEKLWADDLVDYSDEAVALRLIKKAIHAFIQEHSEVDQKARAMLTSQKRDIPEGSSEWETLYRKYYQAELKRKGLD